MTGAALPAAGAARPRRVGLAFLLVAVLLGGFAVLNRTFAYLHVGVLYVTEAILGALLATQLAETARARCLVLPSSRPALLALGAVSAYLAWGLAHLLLALASGSGALETMRNAAVAYYSLFAPLTYAAVRTDPERRTWTLLLLVAVCSSVGGVVTAIIFFVTGGLAELTAYTKVIPGQAVPFNILSALFAAFVAADLPSDRARERRLLVAFIALQVVLIFLSGHRSALLALVAGAAPLVLRLGVRRAVWSAVVGLGLGSLLVVAVPPLRETVLAQAQKYLTLFSGTLTEVNALWRLLFWLRVLDAWAQSPLAGIGLTIDLTIFAPFELPEIETRTDPHNSFLTVLARLGLVGLALLVAAIVGAGLAAWHHGRRAAPGRDRAIALTLCAGLIAMCVFASMNVVLEGPYHGAPFWMLIGLSAAVTTGAPRGQAAPA